MFSTKTYFKNKETKMEEGSSRRSVQPQNEDTVPLSRTVSLL